MDQEVVEEGGDVEEDGLGVEEEFGEEGEVLGVQLGGYELVCVVPSSLLRKCSYLVLLPINLVNRIAIFLVNNLSYRRIVFGRTHFLHTSLSAPRSTVLEREETHTMRRILHKLMRVPKAPMAHIQPLCLAPSDQIFGIEGRIFRRDAQVSQHDVADILRAMHGRSDGRAVLRRGDGWWEGERHGCVPSLRFSSVFFTAWTGSRLCDRDYMAGSLGARRCLKRVSLRMRSRLERIGISR